MNLAIPSALALSIAAVALVYFHDTDKVAAPVIPVVASIACVDHASFRKYFGRPAPVPTPVEKKPEPFAYPEAVMPSFTPLPKPRPHTARRF